MMRRPSDSRVMMEGLEPRQMFNVVNVPDITVPVGSANATFTATVQGAVRSPLTLKFFAIDGTAHGKRDFVYTKSTVTIAAGSNSATFAIPLLNDPVFARLRQFKVHIDVEGSDSAGINATCNIEAAAPTLSLQAATYVSAKGLPNPTSVQGPYVLPSPKAQESFILTFALSSRSSGNPTTFNFAVSDGAEFPRMIPTHSGSAPDRYWDPGQVPRSTSSSGTSTGSSHNTSNDTAVAHRKRVDYVDTDGELVAASLRPDDCKSETDAPAGTRPKAGKRRDFNLVISSLKGAFHLVLQPASLRLADRPAKAASTSSSACTTPRENRSPATCRRLQ